MLYWLIESTDQLKEFYLKGYKEVFIEPILFNDNIHPKLNQLSALYIKPSNNDKGYMLCISHDETYSLDIQHIDTILQEFDTIYVRDLKLISYFFQQKAFIDISYSLNTYIPPTTKTHTYFYNKYPTKPDINKLIPIVKHYEKCELIWKDIEGKFDKAENPYYNVLTILFSLIEKNGIKINNELFDEYYGTNDKSFNIHDNTVYTYYNLHTTTGRTANSFNGINFAALKKNNGERKCFVPKNDYFVEYDVTAYHPNIAAKLIGYDFKGENPYHYFAREAGIELEEAKKLMFRQLYGGIVKEYEHLEFFRNIKVYTDNIWEQFNTGKYICPNSGHVFYKDKLKEMNPPKLFNYLLQNQETYNNVVMLKEILKETFNKKTQLVLTTYDSFLFDVDENETELMNNIKNIFDKYFITKQQTGPNYDFTTN